MEKIKSREKTAEQLKEELRKTREELAVQKWGLKKTLKGMKALVKELVQKKKELAEAYESLKQVDKVKTDFLSLASHQLRTPLSGTKWLIETMLRGITGKIEKKEKEYLDQIYQVNERMIQLVSEMLGVLRLESETGPVKKGAVLISNLYEDISISMTAAAKSREIILHSTLKDHKTAAVETNQEILKSILECFISNAINYSQNGQKVVLDAKEEPNAVVFSVKDSGIGIPKDEQKKMFERFYRASNAKALKPGGSGLGLNTAKMLAEKIGAKISFESEEGKGSTFYLRVPKNI